MSAGIGPEQTKVECWGAEAGGRKGCQGDCWRFSFGCFYLLSDTNLGSPLKSEDGEGSAGDSRLN